MNNGPDCIEAKNIVDEYCEEAYPCEIEALREMDERSYLENPPTVAEACLMNGYTIVSQRVLEQIMEENRRLERLVRELENDEIRF